MIIIIQRRKYITRGLVIFVYSEKGGGTLQLVYIGVVRMTASSPFNLRITPPWMTRQ